MSRTLIIFGLVLVAASPLAFHRQARARSASRRHRNPAAGLFLLFSANDLAHHQRGAERDLVAGESIASPEARPLRCGYSKQGPRSATAGEFATKRDGPEREARGRRPRTSIIWSVIQWLVKARPCAAS